MACVFDFGGSQNAKDHEPWQGFVAMLFEQVTPSRNGKCSMNSTVGEGTPFVNPDKPKPGKGRDFRLELEAARLGLPVQQQTLCKLLGIDKATFQTWEQAGCPKVQIKRADQPEGYVRYDIQAVRAWMMSFTGSVPNRIPKSAGKPKKRRI